MASARSHTATGTPRDAQGRATGEEEGKADAEELTLSLSRAWRTRMAPTQPRRGAQGRCAAAGAAPDDDEEDDDDDEEEEMSLTEEACACACVAMARAW
jgi:hypothetical protein